MTIRVTDVALRRIHDTLEAQDESDHNLRVYVEGGGCAGLQYGLAFEDKQQEDDEVVGQDGFNIIVDRFSAPYLDGMTIDYVTSLQGAGFKIDNPNATGSCGCGHSFKV